ncbi:MAG: hypothetical protein OHK0046_26740 [Anaerolineae bacterium]
MAFSALTATLIGGMFYWRRWHIPVQKSDIEVTHVTGALPPFPAAYATVDEDVQRIPEGVGALFYRSYQVDVEHPQGSIEAIMAEMQARPNHFSPAELAHFEKTKGEDGKLALGDEFFIHITGPWNGPVRTIEVTDHSFAFATLDDHLEAGVIEFKIEEHPEDLNVLRFTIHSWSRSRDELVDLAYDKLGVAKVAQTNMWIYFCNAFVKASGGERIGPVNVMTQRSHEETPVQEPLPLWRRYETQLELARTARLNFDPQKRTEYTEISGWRIDDYEIGLPSEPPGPPIAGGAWEAAKQVIWNYEFPDPELITGIFIPDDPLESRVMVLRARFWWFRFLFSVRIGHVIDETRTTEKGEEVKVWGYSYQTLEGHFELGEITFEVWKFMQTGNVSFRIHAYSKADRIPNLFYRLGFLIFGRRLQIRFAHTAMDRMQRLVTERLRESEIDSASPEEIEQNSPLIQPEE